MTMKKKELGISAIPDVVVYKNGEIVYRFKGNIEEERIRAELERIVSEK